MPPEKYADRTLTIYFPSKEEFREVQEAALAARLGVSHYAREMIRRGREATPIAPDTGLLQENSQNRVDLAKLKRELREKNGLIEKLETQLFVLKQSLFLQPVPMGPGKFSSDLVQLLQSGGTWRSNDIMKHLGIDVANVEAIKVLAGQLHALQDLKLVVEGPKGWKWVG